MKVILSPSKTISLTHIVKKPIPFFDFSAKSLFKDFEAMSTLDIKAFFKCSTEIAQQTKNYFLNKKRYEALKMYQGISFKTFQSFDAIDTKDLCIASGMYGLVGASDALRPYRLDLIHPTKGSLISYWKHKLYAYLKDENRIYLCVSKEYEVLFDTRLPLVFIEIYLHNKKAPSVDAKKVRGALAHFILSHALSNLSSFEYMGYQVNFLSDHLIIIKKES
jgi:cytoplasmic iron level regulating protein YaaA (DUF328/UPF0246 family)